MNVGDTVWIKAKITAIGTDVVDVSVPRDVGGIRCDHVRTIRANIMEAVKPRAKALA